MKNYFLRKLFRLYLATLIATVFVSVVSAQNMFRKVNDFDGDGKSDYAVTRTENGLKVWYVWQSTAGFKTIQWGLGANQSGSGDVNAAGDYDGDGKTDFAVYRKSSAENRCVFYVLQSQTNTLLARQFAFFNANTALHQDYDGDGKTDMASVANDGSGGTVVYFLSATNSTAAFAVPGSGPLRIGDMDGDGRASRAGVTTGTPNTIRIVNFATQATRDVQFGVFGDQYQLADFDGDGIGDLTIWRPTDGNWWWIRSSDSVVNVANWGIGSPFPHVDAAVPGDYDNDGKTDLAVYRRGTAQSPQSYFWVNGSQSGISVFAWGLNTDAAVVY